MKPTRLLLDLDDVLNYFAPYILARLGCGNNPECYQGYPREAGWDIVAAANMLHPTRQFTTAEFWGSVTREMWATAPRSREFSLLLTIAGQHFGWENTFILTIPTQDPECMAGKLEWMQSNLPPSLRRNFLVGPPKYLCAQPDALLIDDNEDNVAAFRRNGGQSLLMPRPWNRFADEPDSTMFFYRILNRLLG